MAYKDIEKNRKASKEWRKNNPEKVKEYRKNHQDYHKEYSLEYHKNNQEKEKEYRNNNKDKIQKYHQEYYKNNQDKIQEHYKNNQEKIKETHKDYRKNNQKKIKEYAKEWRKNNPEIRLKDHIKLLTKLGLVFGMSCMEYKWALQSWTKTIRKIHGEHCAICGSTDRLNSHHIFPKLIHPKLSLNKHNGIPLCKEHHLEVHRLNPMVRR